MWKSVVVATAAFLPSLALRSCMRNSVPADRMVIVMVVRASSIVIGSAPKTGLRSPTRASQHSRPVSNSRLIKPRTGRRSSRPCVTGRSFAFSACRLAKRVNSKPTRRRPRRSIGCRVGPITWLSPAPCSSASPTPARRLYQSLNDAQKERFKNSPVCCGPHSITCMPATKRGAAAVDWREGHGLRTRRRTRRAMGGGHHGRRFGQDDGDQGGRMHRMMGSEEQGSRL